MSGEKSTRVTETLKLLQRQVFVTYPPEFYVVAGLISLSTFILLIAFCYQIRVVNHLRYNQRLDAGEILTKSRELKANDAAITKLKKEFREESENDRRHFNLVEDEMMRTAGILMDYERVFRKGERPAGIAPPDFDAFVRYQLRWATFLQEDEERNASVRCALTIAMEFGVAASVVTEVASPELLAASVQSLLAQLKSTPEGTLIAEYALGTKSGRVVRVQAVPLSC